MKKALFVVLLAGVGVFPYAVLLGVMRINPIVEVSFVLGVACAAALFLMSRRGAWTARELAMGSMAVKLAQTPAYVIWFVVGAAFFLFAGFALAFVVDALTILLSGLVGLAAVLRCRTEGKLTRKAAILHGVLQFVFCVDVFNAIWVYINSRKEKESL